jgi:hypothetical protein
MMNTTTNTMDASIAALPKCQQWRGLGRAAYRAGTTASGAVTYARKYVSHELDSQERKLVMAGWRDERDER